MYFAFFGSLGLLDELNVLLLVYLFMTSQGDTFAFVTYNHTFTENHFKINLPSEEAYI